MAEEKKETGTPKRAVIGVSVSPDEKLAIIKEALEVRNISVSEYMRLKVFGIEPEQKDEPVIDVLVNEERELLEKNILDLQGTNKTLVDENTSLKEELEKLKANTAVPESDILLMFTREERVIIDLAVEYETKHRVLGGTYKNTLDYIYNRLCRVIEDNEGRYAKEYRKSGTDENKAIKALIDRLKNKEVIPIVEQNEEGEEEEEEI